MKRISVLIADDSDAAADGLRSMLDRQRDIEVVGVVRDGVEAISASERLQPNLILMDAQMPEMDGIQASRDQETVASYPGPIHGCASSSRSAGAVGGRRQLHHEGQWKPRAVEGDQKFRPPLTKSMN